MILQPLLVIRILSLVIGTAAIWLLTTRKENKKIIEPYLSALTTWLFAFIGAKVITQWELLLSYPISVLSYPSGTNEFYIACAVSVLWEWRHRKVHIKYGREYVLMLAASFVSFALMNRLVLDQGHIIDVIFAFSFFVFVLFLKQKAKAVFLASLAAVCMGIFSRVPDLVGYRLDVWFYAIIALLGGGWIVLKRGGLKNGV